MSPSADDPENYNSKTKFPLTFRELSLSEKGHHQHLNLSTLEVTHLSWHLTAPHILTSYGRSSRAVLFRQEGVHWLEMLTLTLLNVFLEAWSKE